jgi:Tol biopolymer transport system component
VLSGEYRYDCVRSSSLCILSQFKNDRRLVFSEFDPFLGGDKELTSAEVEAGSAYSWSLSPDGKSIALVDNRVGGKQVRILGLHDGSVRSVPMQGLPQSVSWSPDGKYLYVSGAGQWFSEQVARFGIFQVDLADRTKVLLEVPTNRGWVNSPIPSPDGRYLIYTERTWPSSVVLLENF